jgi:HEAT repeat protein
MRLAAILLAGLALASCSAGPAVSPATIPDATVSFDSRVVELVEQLGVPETRDAAREQLTALGAEAIPVLIRSLTHETEQVRWESANMLGYLRADGAVGPLAERVISDESPHVRWRSLWALARFDAREEIVARLLPGLASENETTAWNAAVSLAFFGSPEGVATLHRGIRSPDPFRRWEAINSLGRVNEGDATVKALQPVLESPSVRDRNETVLTMGQIGGEAAMHALIEALEDEAPDVRWRAAMALGRAGNAAVVPLLEALAESDPDPQVREHATKSASRIRIRGIGR